MSVNLLFKHNQIVEQIQTRHLAGKLLSGLSLVSVASGLIFVDPVLRADQLKMGLVLSGVSFLLQVTALLVINSCKDAVSRAATINFQLSQLRALADQQEYQTLVMLTDQQNNTYQKAQDLTVGNVQQMKQLQAQFAELVHINSQQTAQLAELQKQVKAYQHKFQLFANAAGHENETIKLEDGNTKQLPFTAAQEQGIAEFTNESRYGKKSEFTKLTPGELIVVKNESKSTKGFDLEKTNTDVNIGTFDDLLTGFEEDGNVAPEEKKIIPESLVKLWTTEELTNPENLNALRSATFKEYFIQKHGLTGDELVKFNSLFYDFTTSVVKKPGVIFGGASGSGKTSAGFQLIIDRTITYGKPCNLLVLDAHKHPGWKQYPEAQCLSKIEDILYASQEVVSILNFRKDHEIFVNQVKNPLIVFVDELVATGQNMIMSQEEEFENFKKMSELTNLFNLVAIEGSKYGINVVMVCHAVTNEATGIQKEMRSCWAFCALDTTALSPQMIKHIEKDLQPLYRQWVKECPYPMALETKGLVEHPTHKHYLVGDSGNERAFNPPIYSGQFLLNPNFNKNGGIFSSKIHDYIDKADLPAESEYRMIFSTNNTKTND